MLRSRVFAAALLLHPLALRGAAEARANPPATSMQPEAKAPAAATAADAKAPDGKVVIMQPVKVTAQRIRELDREIRKMDKLISREKQHLKSTELDKALNNDKLTQAAAIFGGNSASTLAVVAAQRLALLETERELLEAMKVPRSLEEVAMLEKEREQVRTTRRNLDNIGHSR